MTNNVQTFRKIVDDKVQNVVARFNIKNFDKNKKIGEYRKLDFEDVLEIFKELESAFGLPQFSIANTIYKRNKGPKNFDYFDELTFEEITNIIRNKKRNKKNFDYFGELTFEEITNIIRNKICSSREAAHNMQTLINSINSKNGIVR